MKVERRGKKFYIVGTNSNAGPWNTYAGAYSALRRLDKRPYDVTAAIMEYESGTLNEAGTLELFKHLVDTGMAWQLQGHYGRMAKALIEAGRITPATK